MYTFYRCVRGALKGARLWRVWDQAALCLQKYTLGELGNLTMAHIIHLQRGK